MMMNFFNLELPKFTCWLIQLNFSILQLQRTHTLRKIVMYWIQSFNPRDPVMVYQKTNLFLHVSTSCTRWILIFSTHGKSSFFNSYYLEYSMWGLKYGVDGNINKMLILMDTLSRFSLKYDLFELKFLHSYILSELFFFFFWSYSFFLLSESCFLYLISCQRLV